ncbi:MAG: ABC transporter permease [Spirochaetaceae bacterium]|nr:ABC transporter permease [Spirochaetaceae bacterium]
MLRYVVRRLLLTIPTLFLVATIVFLLLRLVPGDMVDTVMARLAVLGGTVDRAALERAFGLDAPLHVQYVRWWADLLLRGSLGISMNSGQPVVPLILGRLPVTIELGLLGIAVSVVIGLPVGIYSALRQDTVGDYAGRSLAILFVAAPSFWVATLVILYASLWWGWSPPLELVPLVRDPIGNLRMFILPAFILGMVMAGTTMRMTRTMMLEVLRQDFIRTAYAKGLRERLVVVGHALKNALIPVVTIVGADLTVLIGGAVIIESIFALPGTGRLMVDALKVRDYALVSGVNLVFAVAVVGANLLVDLSYAFLDPRVRYR